MSPLAAAQDALIDVLIATEPYTRVVHLADGDLKTLIAWIARGCASRVAARYIDAYLARLMDAHDDDVEGDADVEGAAKAVRAALAALTAVEAGFPLAALYAAIGASTVSTACLDAGYYQGEGEMAFHVPLTTR